MEIEPTALIKNMRHDDPLISPEVKYILGAIFLLLILMSLYRKYFKKKKEINMGNDNSYAEQNKINAAQYIVTGMSCTHCVANVKNAIDGIDGVVAAEVDLDTGKTTVSGEFDSPAVIRAIEKAGYTAEIV